MLRNLVGSAGCLRSTRRLTTLLRPVDLAAKARDLGVSLTPGELEEVRRRLDVDDDGLISADEFCASGRHNLEKIWARDFFLESVDAPSHSPLGSRLLASLDYAGTSLFAVVRRQISNLCPCLSG